MALGMRLWTTGAVLACAALAIAALPPGAVERRDLTTATPERRAASDARARLIAANEAVRRIRWSDSLAGLTWGSAERESPVAIGVPSQLIQRWAARYPEMATAADVDKAMTELTRRVTVELEEMGREKPAVDLGFFLVNSELSGEPIVRGYPDRPTRFMQRKEWYAAAKHGRPYCLSVQASGSPNTFGLLSFGQDPAGGNNDNTLGPCRLYARHGMPGPHIQEWMISAGGALAVDLDDAPLPRDPTQRASGWFFRHPRIDGVGLAYQACLSGTSNACRSLVLERPLEPYDAFAGNEPEIRSAGVPLLGGKPMSRGPYVLANEASHRMLDALERRFGHDAFARFWTSEATVPEAFEAAFGLTPAEWGYRWASEVYGEGDRSEVTPGAGETALAGGYMLLALGAAAALVRRRRVA